MLPIETHINCIIFTETHINYCTVNITGLHITPTYQFSWINVMVSGFIITTLFLLECILRVPWNYRQMLPSSSVFITRKCWQYLKTCCFSRLQNFGLRRLCWGGLSVNRLTLPLKWENKYWSSTLDKNTLTGMQFKPSEEELPNV